MGKNPWIVDPDTERLDLTWVDRDGVSHQVWLDVKHELSVGEHRKMMRTVSTVTQPILARGQAAATPEAKLEWTEYSFARMVAYVVDWSLAHEAEHKLPVSRASYEKLRQDLFAVIDDALDAHEQRHVIEKKVTPTSALPSAISA